jgi:hypothetical protein
MKIHNNLNYLKSLGPTPAEIQKAIQAEQNRQPIKIENETTEKIRKFAERGTGAKNKVDGQPESRSRNPDSGKDSEKQADEEKTKKPGSEEGPSAPPHARIDIRI